MNPLRIRLAAGIAGALFLTSCATYRLDSTTSSELEARLQALAEFEYGQDRAPAIDLSRWLDEGDAPSSARRTAVEARLATFAEDTTASRAGRQQVIHELGRVGSVRSAPALIRLLPDPELGDDAAMALQRMTDPGVAIQVLDSLPSFRGAARERAIAVLGQARCADAVPGLAGDAGGPDEDLAAAAVIALGRIATPAAAACLIDVLPKLAGSARLAMWPALLACQESARLGHDGHTAEIVTTALSEASPPRHVLAASKRVALRSASPQEIETGLVELLESTDSTLQSVGADLARERLPEPLLLAVCQSLPRFPEASQIALLGILEDRGLPAATPFVEALASSPSQAIRCAAIRALGHAGEASSLALIAEATVAQAEAVREAAAASLRLISGPGIDEGLLDLARTADAPVRVEVLSAIGDRGMTDALPALFETAGDADGAVRRAAIRELGALAGPPDWSRLLDLLHTVQQEEDRRALASALGVAGRRIPDSGEAVVSILSSTTNVQIRVSLLAWAGQVRDPATLPELARAASDPHADICNAALRALGNWSSLSALPALVTAASGTDDSSRRLAVRGALRVLRQAEPAADADPILPYREIAAHIEHPDDRRLLLSAIAELDAPDALVLAAEYLDDADVRAEAEAAVIRIAPRIREPDEAARAALRQIAAESESEAMRSRAGALLMGE